MIATEAYGRIALDRQRLGFRQEALATLAEAFRGYYPYINRSSSRMDYGVALPMALAAAMAHLGIERFDPAGFCVAPPKMPRECQH